ncbi:MAG: CRISPR-associated endonuclease Cas2 [Ardenticatenaceae bacterium]|nr:CRISPR-associated endonuclease Cas2 [Ardenticatenaceae bacterium]
MRVVISYDISNDKRRRKVATIMEGYGYRVQFSVFECDLTAQQLKAALKALRPYVKKADGDSIRFYPLPADAVEKIQVIGNDLARTLGTVAIV